MKKFIILLLLLISTTTFSQYDGGNEDGFSHNAFNDAIMNEQSVYCGGGTADGFFLSEFSGYAFDDQIAYLGGDNDGQSVSKMTPSGPMNIQQFYCSSGDDDGFDFNTFSGYSYPAATAYSGGIKDGFSNSQLHTVLNNQQLYCNGSDKDGFSISVYQGFAFSPLAFQGGQADGFSVVKESSYMFDLNIFAGGTGDGGNDIILSNQYLGYGIWRGITDQNWNQASNWTHNMIPGASTIVTIPSSCIYYPLLDDRLNINGYLSTYMAKRVDIMSGGLLTTEDEVNIYGELNVWGSFNSESNINRLIRIQNGGSVVIDSAGSMLLGKQTMGPALTDLVIYNGGELHLRDGILEIDDQLNVMNGGMLEMQAGSLFTHKFGEGSPIGPWLDYSPFYIESGALGGIYGGTVRVVGKPSTSFLAAIQINEPSFSFSDNSLLVINNGNSPIMQDCELKVAEGVSLGKLRINDGKTLILKSDLEVRNQLNVNPGAELKVESGHELSIGE